MPGDRVLIVGPGAIGLLAAQVAAAGGAEVEVRGVAQDGPRLALARALGCATSLAGVDALDDGAYDVTVDCSGAGPGIADALRAARPGGRHVQIGLAGMDVTLPVRPRLLQGARPSPRGSPAPRPPGAGRWRCSTAARSTCRRS